MSQQGPVPIGYFEEVNLIRALQLVVSEVDVDDTAFGNFDGFSLVKVVGVGRWEVRRRHHSTCWKALWFFRQSTYKKITF